MEIAYHSPIHRIHSWVVAFYKYFVLFNIYLHIVKTWKKKLTQESIKGMQVRIFLKPTEMYLFFAKIMKK